MHNQCLDTGICIEALRRPDGTVANRLRTLADQQARSLISSVVRHELELGARISARPVDGLAKIAKLYRLHEAAAFDDTAAVASAALDQAARKLGRMLGGRDVLIAGHAKALDAVLLTTDHALSNALSLIDPGLGVELWIPDQ